MIKVFTIGKDNTMPYYGFEVRNIDGVVDLSALGVSTVYFAMVRISTGSIVVSAPAQLTDAEHGRGEYRWAVVDTANTGDFAVSFLFRADAGNFSLPRAEMAKVVVEDRFVTGGSS